MIQLFFSKGLELEYFKNIWRQYHTSLWTFFFSPGKSSLTKQHHPHWVHIERIYPPGRSLRLTVPGHLKMHRPEKERKCPLKRYHFRRTFHCFPSILRGCVNFFQGQNVRILVVTEKNGMVGETKWYQTKTLGGGFSKVFNFHLFTPNPGVSWSNLTE